MSHRTLRKRVNGAPVPPPPADDQWLDITHLATIEITSETAENPIEGALGDTAGKGWRAGTQGRQTLRVQFDEPQRLERIWLEFEESAMSRTQEVALEWVAEDGARRGIVRQRWSFSPASSTREILDYRVGLPDVRTLDLVIEPDIATPEATASLQRLRLR